MTGAGRAPIHTGEYYRRLRRYETEDAWARAMGDWTLELIRRHAPAAETLRVLDVGCGAGGFLARCRTELGATICGFDVASFAVQVAREVDVYTVAQASAEAYPFPPDSFDVIVAHDVLQHLTDARAQSALREAERALRPGGLLVVRAASRRGLLWKKHIDSADYAQWSPRGLRIALERAGLSTRYLTLANAGPSLLSDVAAFLTQPRPVGDVGLEAPERPPAWKVSVLSAYWRLERSALIAGAPGLYGHSLIAAATKPIR